MDEEGVNFFQDFVVFQYGMVVFFYYNSLSIWVFVFVKFNDNEFIFNYELI